MAKNDPAEFTVGAIVKLNSGGHQMTVSKVDATEIECVWSDGKKTRREIFSCNLLSDASTPQSLSIHFTPSLANIDDVIQELRALPSPVEGEAVLHVTQEQMREILRRRFVHPNSNGD